MQSDYTKRPRLYTPETLAMETPIALNDGQAHYLRSVIRLQEGDTLRLFNEHSGEWAARLLEVSKKSAIAAPFQQLKQPAARSEKIHLIFAPIKKNRLDFLIEKAVELGVTDLHPVISARTENRHLNEERLQAQIIEASEQCERLDLPQLHKPMPLLQKLRPGNVPAPVLWGRERGDARALKDCDLTSPAFLIGPEGGFDDSETAFLENHAQVTAISLGPRVLRSETAALAALSFALLSQA